MKTYFFLLTLFLVFASGTAGCTPESKPAPTAVVADSAAADKSGSGLATETERPRDASDEFFEGGEIPELKIEVPEGELKQLRENSKAYVRCTIRQNEDVVFKSVGI